MPSTTLHAKPTRLKVTDDKGFEKVVLIDTTSFVIGVKAPGGLEIPPEEGDPVAARHAVIVKEGDVYILEDRSGSCGTRVNGRPIRRTQLKHGDEIRLGKSAYRVQFLVEGTRAADHYEKRVKAMLKMLLDLHACVARDDVPARAMVGVMHLIAPSWVALVLGGSGQPLKVAAGGDAAGALPGEPTPLGRHVAETGRLSFQPQRLCVPILDRSGRTLVGVVDIGPREGRPYSAEDVELLEVMAAHIGIALGSAGGLMTAAAAAAG